MKRLILASSSPRRKELLRNAGFQFEVIPSRVEEVFESDHDPAEVVERLALHKAEEVAGRVEHGDVVVLGADTVVVADGEPLGKPKTDQEAVAMLERLSGREHQVITGIALVDPRSPRRALAHQVTRVFFRSLEREEIDDYVASGEPVDKAGAYAIQGRAGRFVTRLEGCYFNVMGLPVALVDRLCCGSGKRNPARSPSVSLPPAAPRACPRPASRP
jgi:septum formation protein